MRIHLIKTTFYIINIYAQKHKSRIGADESEHRTHKKGKGMKNCYLGDPHWKRGAQPGAMDFATHSYRDCLFLSHSEP